MRELKPRGSEPGFPVSPGRQGFRPPAPSPCGRCAPPPPGASGHGLSGAAGGSALTPTPQARKRHCTLPPRSPQDPLAQPGRAPPLGEGTSHIRKDACFSRPQGRSLCFAVCYRAGVGRRKSHPQTSLMRTQNLPLMEAWEPHPKSQGAPGSSNSGSVSANLGTEGSRHWHRKHFSAGTQKTQFWTRRVVGSVLLGDVRPGRHPSSPYQPPWPSEDVTPPHR